MRNRAPLLTLLAGVVVASVLVGVNVASGKPAKDKPAAAADVNQADPGAGGAESSAPPAPAGSTPPEASTPPEQSTPPAKSVPPQAAPAPDTTLVGKVGTGGATVAIVTKGNTALAYVCDGKRTEAWLRGSARDGKLNLSGKDGTTLTGEYDALAANGVVTLAKKTQPFEAANAKPPSGLYRAAASVRGARVVGGWIVTADGRQVGLARVDDALVVPSNLDTKAGTARVGDQTVSPKIVTGAEVW